MSEETLRTRQIDLEQESVVMGQARYEERDEPEADTPPGRKLVKMAVEPTALLIIKFIEAANSGKAGRKHVALPYIAQIDPMQAAFLTSRAALNCAADNKALITAAKSIGHAVRDHLELAALASKHPGLYRKVAEQLKRSTSATHRLGVYREVIRRYKGKELAWSEKECILLGTKLLELFIEATDMVELKMVVEGKTQRVTRLRFNPEWEALILKGHKQCALLSPVHLPMLHPPRAWRHPYSGGYLTEVMHPRLVRTRSREYLDELGSVDLTDVMAAVNTIQSVPWKINGRVLDVMRTFWDAEMGCKGLPSRHDKPLPPRPAGVPIDVPSDKLTVSQQEDLKAWKARASKVHGENEALKSERGQMAQKLHVADRFAPEAAIYFPHYLDFRGRVYPFANYLNPQGDDVAKGLLLFAEGKPLGETGGFWLAVHIANLFGVDKVSFEDRVAWVMENEERILDAALDPIDGLRFWEDADSPFCALAACFEWAGFKVHGEAWVSHLPIAMDGSCSGLQHFSALLRDPVGGAAVNLVPSEKPGDIYTAVAQRAQVLSDKSDSEYASVWEGKFCRKVAKQPTMTLCYSATKFGMQLQIEAALRKLDDEHGRYLGGDCDNHQAAVYAAGIVWDAIGETVVAARRAMDWLQVVAKVLAKANLPIRWTTPLGLPVLQDYRKTKGEVLNAFVDGVRVQINVSVDTETVEARRQAAGIAPNFVHSLDSSHLMRTALLCKENGIGSLAVIHDSFGTHACDTDKLHTIIREAFVTQYTPDLLSVLRDEVIAQLEPFDPEAVAEIPPVPAFGTLDLEAIRSSDFLFA